MGLRKSLYIGLGIVAVILGIIGIFLPVLPTVPFLLLAAWCFERGSETLHNWIVTHKHLGPPIKEWKSHGVIRPRAKVLAVTLITLSFSYVLFYRQLMMPVRVFLGALGVSVIIFILTRPSTAKTIGESREN